MEQGEAGRVHLALSTGRPAGGVRRLNVPAGPGSGVDRFYARAGGLRVLLVEDNPGDAILVRELLRETGAAGVELWHAGSLHEALRALEKKEPPADVVLLDLSLPDAFGLEGIGRIEALAPEVPIVIMTGSEDEALLSEAMEKGTQDYLIKGQTDGRLLLRSLRYAIERHKLKCLLVEANGHLERLALYDPLTQVLNRRGIKRSLARGIRERGGAGTAFHVLLIDLDDFKYINDTFGHAAGDALLEKVASVIETTVRASDQVARIGGDEFLVLLPATSPKVASQIAERVRSGIEALQIKIGADLVRATASLALAPLAEEEASIDAILALTHESLYRSKLGGKNRISVRRAEEPGEQSLRLSA